MAMVQSSDIRTNESPIYEPQSARNLSALAYSPRTQLSNHWPQPVVMPHRSTIPTAEAVGVSVRAPQMNVLHTKTKHASASHRLYVHLIWPTKYRKHVLGEKLTPLVESKIVEVCHMKQ